MNKNLNIDILRKQIDNVDDQILNLFLKRLEYVREIGKIKKDNSISVLDSSREKQILDRLADKSDDYKQEIELLFFKIMEISKDVQRRL